MGDRASTALSSPPRAFAALQGESRVYAHGGFRVECESHPIVLVRFPERVEREAYEWLFELYSRLSIETSTPIGWLIDLDEFDAIGSTAAQRRDAAQIFDKHRDAIAQGTLCEARVLSRSVARNILTAFDWLTSSSWPRRNFASMEEAIAWIRDVRERP